jgi:hypothetical protein
VWGKIKMIEFQAFAKYVPDFRHHLIVLRPILDALILFGLVFVPRSLLSLLAAQTKFRTVGRPESMKHEL